MSDIDAAFLKMAILFLSGGAGLIVLLFNLRDRIFKPVTDRLDEMSAEQKAQGRAQQELDKHLILLDGKVDSLHNRLDADERRIDRLEAK